MSTFINGEGNYGQAPVKYAAYKPKRHSRTSSVGNSISNVSNTPTPSYSTATSRTTTPSLLPPGPDVNGHAIGANHSNTAGSTFEYPINDGSIRMPSSEQRSPVALSKEKEQIEDVPSSIAHSDTPPPASTISPSQPAPIPSSVTPASTGSLSASMTTPSLNTSSSSRLVPPLASSSSSTSTAATSPHTLTHTSTFRRVRPSTSSPLARPNSVLLPEKSQDSFNTSTSILSAPTSPTRVHNNSIPPPTSPRSRPVSVLESISLSPSRSPAPTPPVVITSPSQSHIDVDVTQTTISPTPTPAPAPTSSSKPSASTKPSSSKTPKAPYRPGFQPTGLTRFRTDEFLAARKVARDGSGGGLDKRVERTKLERRLEKIIKLHFPEEESPSSKEQEEKPKKGVVAVEMNGKRRNVNGREVEDKEKKDPRLSLSANGKPQRPGLLGIAGDTRRRTSSFFENLDIRRMSSSFIGGVGFGEEESVRSSEQRITPWQPDSAVSRCPHCDVSFHPLSNRKHHCRLCGRVVCALPVKRGERNEPCSFLFVVDPKTRLIEEVEEGVDYGVRKRKPSSVDLRPQDQRAVKQDPAEDEEEKFLRGVRICRECKPVLRRQQYVRERTPGADRIAGEFLTLYEALIGLEREIEEKLLPKFEELLDGLNKSKSSGETSTLELSSLTATAATERKHLLQVFAKYDALAKRIRNLPPSNGNKRIPGSKDVKKDGGLSSQERVQAAIAVRAARFLEVRMVGLGVVPAERDQKHKRSASSSRSSSSPSSNAAETSSTTLKAHKTLQPLLEQESLLESYVAEATKARKFEDAKILRGNLREIREEIERVVEGDLAR
ncbi:FYVE zinc finger-domain-containing protein [Lentinula raphanica]|nr:FYVE zinc finger-domain-containing protein [Lentinula raphanica]